MARLGEGALWLRYELHVPEQLSLNIIYHAKEAVFRLELNVSARTDVVRGQSRNANTQVAVHAVLQTI